MSNQVDIKTIQNQLNYLDETKTQIKEALIGKGLPITEETPFRDYVTQLNSLENIMRFDSLEEMNSTTGVADGTLALVYKNGGRKINTETFKGPIVLPRILDVGMDLEELSKQMGWLTTSAVSNYWGGTTNSFRVEDDLGKTVLSGYVRCEHYNYSNNTDRYMYEWRLSVYNGDGTTTSLVYSSPAGQPLRNYTYYTLNISADKASFELPATSSERTYHIVLGVNEKGVETSPMVSILMRSGGVEFEGMYRYDSANNSWYHAMTDLTTTRLDVLSSRYLGINGIETGSMGEPKYYTDATLRDLKNQYNVFSNLMNTMDTTNMTNFYNFSKSTNLIYFPFLMLSNRARNCANMFDYRQASGVYLNKWDVSGVTNMYAMFRGSTLFGNTSTSNWDCSNVTNMSLMFYYSNVNGCMFSNTHKVTDMSQMFVNCDLNWNQYNGNMFEKWGSTSNVTNTYKMFENCTKANAISVGQLQFQNSLNTANMFCNCQNLSYFFYNGSWGQSNNVSWGSSLKATNMAGMFYNCRNIGSIRIGNYSSMGRYSQNMTNMFYDCHRYFGMQNWYSGVNMSNCLYASNMFWNCFNLSWGTAVGNMSNIIIASNMFYGCKSMNIKSFNQLKFDMLSAQNLYGMFNGCVNLTSSPITNWNMPNLIDATGMFSNTGIRTITFTGADMPKLTSLSRLISHKGVTTVTIKNGVFNGMTELRANSGVNVLTIDNVRVNNQDTLQTLSQVLAISPNLESVTFTNMDLSNVTSLMSAFANCNNLTSITLPANFTFENVTNMYNTFYLMKLVKNIDVIKNKNLTNVTNLSQCFQGMWNLTNFTDMNVQFTNVTNLANTFRSDSNLTIVNLDAGGGSTVTNTSNMFYGCGKLTDVTLNLNTVNCISLSGMFNDCYSLKNISVAHLDTSNCKNLSMMFYNCSNLVDIDLSKFNFANATTTVQMFYNCKNLNNWNFSDNVDCALVNNAYGMFYQSSVNNASQILQWNFVNLTNMTYMFYNCRNLDSNLVLQNVAYPVLNNMYQMFHNCKTLQTVAISNVNVPVMNTLYECFRLCDNLTSVNLTDISTTSTNINMSSMFIQCNNLTDVVITNCLSNVKNVGGMFYYCNNLTNTSINNIITWLLANTALPYKNLNTSNYHSPFYYTNIYNSRYLSRHQELTDAGWTY